MPVPTPEELTVMYSMVLIYEHAGESVTVTPGAESGEAADRIGRRIRPDL
jgi:hypothetical protein